MRDISSLGENELIKFKQDVLTFMLSYPEIRTMYDKVTQKSWKYHHATYEHYEQWSENLFADILEELEPDSGMEGKFILQGLEECVRDPRKQKDQLYSFSVIPIMDVVNFLKEKGIKEQFAFTEFEGTEVNASVSLQIYEVVKDWLYYILCSTADYPSKPLYVSFPICGKMEAETIYELIEYHTEDRFVYHDEIKACLKGSSDKDLHLTDWKTRDCHNMVDIEKWLHENADSLGFFMQKDRSY